MKNIIKGKIKNNKINHEGPKPNPWTKNSRPNFPRS